MIRLVPKSPSSLPRWSRPLCVLALLVLVFVPIRVTYAAPINGSPVDIYPPVTVTINGAYVDMTVHSVWNKSTAATGSLRIELWALKAPLSGSNPNIYGYKTAQINTSAISGGADSLPPNTSLDNIQMHLAYTAPSDPSYNSYVLVVEEKFSNCTTTDQFCSDAYYNVTPTNGGGGGGGVSIGAGMTGSWYDPSNSGHGFTVEVLPNNQMFVTWYVYSPTGGPTWVTAQGSYSGNSANLTAYQRNGSGALFPPNFNPAATQKIDWGSITLTFTDCSHATASYSSSQSGYGSGTIYLTRLTQPIGLTCP